ncbi:hypothetical protein Pelo_12592 [Pelomyxa schiedti]|nr:hypothetical protein Pelo_12592 [Pelomyxa schiedti]
MQQPTLLSSVDVVNAPPFLSCAHCRGPVFEDGVVHRSCRQLICSGCWPSAALRDVRAIIPARWGGRRPGEREGGGGETAEAGAGAPGGSSATALPTPTAAAAAASPACNCAVVCPKCNKPIGIDDEDPVPMCLLSEMEKVEVKCKCCTEVMLRSQYQQHYERACLTECENQCGERLCRSNQEEHNQGCPKLKVPCQHCNLLVVRDCMEAHLTTDCSGTQVACPCGCQWVGRRSELGAHTQKCSVDQISLLRDQVSLLRDQVSLHQQEINTLKEKVEALESQKFRGPQDYYVPLNTMYNQDKQPTTTPVTPPATATATATATAAPLSLSSSTVHSLMPTPTASSFSLASSSSSLSQCSSKSSFSSSSIAPEIVQLSCLRRDLEAEATHHFSYDGRTIYIFAADPAKPLADYRSFAADKKLRWWKPRTQQEAIDVIHKCQQLAPRGKAHIDTAWVVTRGVATQPRERLYGGFSLGNAVGEASERLPNAGACDGNGFTAVRMPKISWCNPEYYGFTRCWDERNTYDWLVTEEDPAFWSAPSE